MRKIYSNRELEEILIWLQRGDRGEEHQTDNFVALPMLYLENILRLLFARNTPHRYNFLVNTSEQ